MQAYCVKCHAKREKKDAKSITVKNGKPATQGMSCMRNYDIQNRQELRLASQVILTTGEAE